MAQRRDGDQVGLVFEKTGLLYENTPNIPENTSISCSALLIRPLPGFQSADKFVRLANYLVMRIAIEKHGGNPAAEVLLRKPQAADAVRVWDLVAACPPLDRNSVYCNLLQCADFSDTCVLAESNGDAVGWISGYRPPGAAATLFIWQVAVHERARGLGLAGRMLLELLQRESVDGISYLKTTITPDNDASRALFRSVAARAGAPLHESSGFDANDHFGGRHASERLITIGPLRQARNAQSAA
jgi:L-2,4-diaminobutyric acid acetyltransferase